MNSNRIDPVGTEDSKVVVTTDCAPVMSCVNPAALFLFPQDIFTKAMPEARIAHNDIATVMGTLSNTCSYFHSLFKKPLAETALRLLCQAVIDDKREQVKKILDARPDLLMMDPPENSVIQSQCTWLRMYAENPLVMAAKRRQIEMIKLLLPYYDKLPQTNAVMDAKAKGLSAWVHYEIFKSDENEDEIVIPEKYVEYAKNMLDVCCKETFPNGVPGQNNIPMNVALSKETEEALKSLFNNLLPKHAVKLDDYFDVELLLLAVYKAYRDHFNQFQNWEQRDTFCVRVIGLIQGVQSPETAKIFCQGLEAVVTALEKGEEIKLSENACEHKLKGGAAYFRIGRDSFIGLGFHFLCGVYGCGDETGAAGALTGTTFRCRKIMSSKSSKFLECYAAVSTATPRPFKS